MAGRGLVWFQEVRLLGYCFKKGQNTNWSVSILVVVLKRCMYLQVFGIFPSCPHFVWLVWNKSVTTAVAEVEEHGRGPFGFHRSLTLEHIFHYRLLSAYQVVIGQVASVFTSFLFSEGLFGMRVVYLSDDGHRSLISHYGSSHHVWSTKMHFKIHIFELVQILVGVTY